MTDANDNSNFVARFFDDYFELCERNKILGPVFGVGFLLLAFLCLMMATVSSPTEDSLRAEIYHMKQDAKKQAWMTECLKENKQWKCELLFNSPGSPWQWLDQ